MIIMALLSQVIWGLFALLVIEYTQSVGHGLGVYALATTINIIGFFSAYTYQKKKRIAETIFDTTRTYRKGAKCLKINSQRVPKRKSH